MSKGEGCAFTVSLDGLVRASTRFAESLGVRGEELHAWFVDTDVFKKMQGEGDGRQGIDNDFAAQSMDNLGAWILGRNMFGPVRGPWKDESWKGWWGDDPRTIRRCLSSRIMRARLTMEGGTTFYFVTDGIESALKKAKDAAKGKMFGLVVVLPQFVLTGLIDEIHLALSPVFLGEGEHLFIGLNLHALGFTTIKTVASEKATHVLIKKR